MRKAAVAVVFGALVGCGGADEQLFATEYAPPPVGVGAPVADSGSPDGDPPPQASPAAGGDAGTPAAAPDSGTPSAPGAGSPAEGDSAAPDSAPPGTPCIQCSNAAMAVFCPNNDPLKTTAWYCPHGDVLPPSAVATTCVASEYSETYCCDI